MPKDADLDKPMDLQLVLLPFADVSQAKVNELTDAARRGAAAEARTHFLMYASRTAKNVRFPNSTKKESAQLLPFL